MLDRGLEAGGYGMKGKPDPEVGKPFGQGTATTTDTQAQIFVGSVCLRVSSYAVPNHPSLWRKGQFETIQPGLRQMGHWDNSLCLPLFAAIFS